MALDAHDHRRAGPALHVDELVVLLQLGVHDERRVLEPEVVAQHGGNVTRECAGFAIRPPHGEAHARIVRHASEELALFVGERGRRIGLAAPVRRQDRPVVVPALSRVLALHPVVGTCVLVPLGTGRRLEELERRRAGRGHATAHRVAGRVVVEAVAAAGVALVPVRQVAALLEAVHDADLHVDRIRHAHRLRLHELEPARADAEFPPFRFLLGRPLPAHDGRVLIFSGRGREERRSSGRRRVLGVQLQEAQTAAHVGRQQRAQRVRGGNFARIVLKRREHRLDLRDRRHDEAAAIRHRHLIPQNVLRGVRVADRHGVRRHAARAERGVARRPCVGGGHRHVRRDVHRARSARENNGDKRQNQALLHTALRPLQARFREGSVHFPESHAELYTELARLQMKKFIIFQERFQPDSV